ncbi:MAG: TetR/AcrR family transcriptional regulator [Solirubrobacterales bacterium]
MKATLETRTERRRKPAGERRETIIRAAAPLFGRNGYTGTRLDDIAAAAGVTKPIVYRHFGSKKDLYMVLLRKHRDDLPSFIESVEPPVDDSSEALLRSILESWLDYVRVNHDQWAMLFRDRTGDEEIQALRAEVSVRAREVMAGFISARAGAKIPLEQIAPSAELLTSGLAGLALWWRERPEVPKATLLEAVMRFLGPALS